MAHATYLTLELAWGVPVLALQWAVGFRVLRSSWKTLFVATAAATVYLSVADGVALSTGIWTVHASKVVGVRVGPLPLEEILFFSLTNTMIVQTLILLRYLPDLSKSKSWLRMAPVFRGLLLDRNR